LSTFNWGSIEITLTVPLTENKWEIFSREKTTF